MSYEINYDDQKFKDVETDKNKAISDLDKTYSGMVEDTEASYQAQIDASKEWEKKQTELQNQQTDFAIKEIEQEKDQAKKDYTKEQSGAYVDWQKQSNEYGAEAEQMAAQGMTNTGYSESSQVAMYTAYQNRVATARETHNRIVMDFNNAITEARLQNNSALAEIAFKAQQQRLELNLQMLQSKNALLLEQASKKTELEQMYHERWQDVLAQMNTENALAEEQRQFNESMALEKEQFAWQKEQAEKKSSGGGSSGGSSKKSSSGSKTGGTIQKSSNEALNKETRDSILSLGQGPISAENLANQVASGKVTQSTSSSGNTVFKQNTTGSKFGLLWKK